jgi:hypothetical protein
VKPRKLASIATYLLSMTPDLEEVVEPPDVSRLTMQRPLASAPIANHGWQLRDGTVAAAADKNLVVLSSGSYRPAYSYNRWYLLLDLDAAADASASCLSSIPAIHYEYADSYSSAGYGTVIMTTTTTREGGGGGASFVLAELLWDFHRRGGLPALGMLCVWQSWLCSWVYKRGELPAEVLQTWRIHMSFPVETRSRRLFCWVDLLHGLLLCDPGRQCEVDSSDSLDMCFVPLPHGCSVVVENPRWSSKKNPLEFRNAACVGGGTIKFLTMEREGGGAMSLVTYTLDLDNNPSNNNDPASSWMAETKLLLEDLCWADETTTFISNKKDVVPRKITPPLLFPILSTVEHMTSSTSSFRVMWKQVCGRLPV